MTARRWRPALVVALIAFVAVQVFAAVAQGDGGWTGEYGFPAALVDFFDLSLGDPLLTAGVTDFVVLIVAFGFWALADLPAATRWSGRTYAWLVAYGLFPGLGVLLYVLWLRPAARVGAPA